jgi:hypothetical protein
MTDKEEEEYFVPEYKKEHQCDKLLGTTSIPHNFWKPIDGQNVFNNKIPEDHKLEQFFWNEDTVRRLMESCKYLFENETCCLMTPTIAHLWHTEEGRDEVLLDIDKRFDYLPKYRYYDVRVPETIKNESFRLIIMDPPFFIIPIEVIAKAVEVLTGGDPSVKIMIAYYVRGEQKLRTALKKYNLFPTKFKLVYDCFKENKLGNFVLYSNIELPGIKRSGE